MDNSEVTGPDPGKDKPRVEGQSPSGMPETSPVSDLEKRLGPDTPDEIVERCSGIQRRASLIGSIVHSDGIKTLSLAAVE